MREERGTGSGAALVWNWGFGLGGGLTYTHDCLVLERRDE